MKRGCKRTSNDDCPTCDEENRIKKLKVNNLIITHCNLRGLNSNLEFANVASMTSNICFFTECMCETQLDFENAIYAPNKKTFSKNSIKYKKKGRPTGGLLFVVDRNLNVNCRFISRRTGIITLNQLAIIGSYMPSYDGRPSTEIAYKKELFQIEQERNKLLARNYEVIIIGDLNVDINRQVKNYKRKTSFTDFINQNDLVIQENIFEQNLDHSYHNEHKDKNNKDVIIETRSTIDYTLSNSKNKNFLKVQRYAHKLNNSDHHPTIIEYNMINDKSMPQIYCSKSKNHTNWLDKEFVENYKNRVNLGCVDLIRRLKLIKDITSKSKVELELNKINQDFQHLLLQSKDKAKNELYLSGHSTKRQFNGKPKKWWNDELQCAFQRVFKFKNKLKENKDDKIEMELLNEIKLAKKEFRTLKRFNLKLVRDCNLRKIDELFKNNKISFWNKLKKLDNKKQDIEADLESIREDFKKIFTIRNNVNKKHEEKINTAVDKFIKESFELIHNMVIDDNIISNYISDLSNGKSIGISQISNEMLKNANTKNLSTTIALIFEIIINHGVVPQRFNTSILKPLVKDVTKSTKEATNLRPLAISDAISNMFEKLMLHFIDVIYINHFLLKRKQKESDN